MTATIVKAWQDQTKAYLAVVVTEPGGDVVEYVGSVPLDSLAGMSLAEKRAALVGAVKTVRDAQQRGRQDLAISGTITL